jgi:BspA type Leucine rich repeat region (6 copies)/Bacterial Ig-like domain (group 1)
MRHVSTSVRAAAVLLLVGAATLVAVSPASAANPSTDFTFTFSGTSATITHYAGTDPVVDIPATVTVGGTDYDVTTIGTDAFRGNDLLTQLTSVTIPDSVTTIGDSAFRGDLLTSIVIPDSVTNIETYAFYGNALTSVTFANSITTLGNNSFRGNDLTLVTIPGSVTSVGNNTFAENAALTSVIFDGAAPTTFTAAGAAGSLGPTVGLTVYYYAGATGFTSLWNGYAASAISAADSTLALSPAGPYTADGVTSVTLTVTVNDDADAPVVGVPVAFIIPAAFTATATSCTTGTGGICTIALTSTTAGTQTVSARVGSDPTVISQSITFTAVPGAPVTTGGDSGSGTDSSSSLAFTGVNATVPLILGGSLLVLGLAFLTATLIRRRKSAK